MRFSLTSLLRLIAFTFLGLSVVAVGLSRVTPRVSRPRTELAPRYVGINGASLMPPDSRNYLLDTETGRVEPLEPIRGVALDFVSCSPWKEDQGGFELAGRLTTHSGVEGDRQLESSGLGLVRLVGRELLSRSGPTPLLSGRPCWMPGHPTSLLCPAGDGRLHLLDFTDESGGEVEPREGDTFEPETGSAARTLTWKCPVPGFGPLLVSDPICPPVPALGGRILVSLSSSWEENGSRGFNAFQIWWLRLDPTGTVVQAVGRLTATAPGHSPRDDRRGRADDERLANVAVTPDGKAVLAFLAQRPNCPGWSLKLAPLGVDTRTGDPVARLAKARDVAEDVSCTPPAFAADGRWVYAVSRLREDGPNVERIDVLDALRSATIGAPTSFAARIGTSPRADGRSARGAAAGTSRAS